MENGYKHYLSRYYSQDTARLKWNALAALHHHALHFPTDMNSAILEVGPGTGALLTLLKQCGYRNVKGVDVSEEAVNACNKLIPGSVELGCDSVEFLKNQHERMDLVLMIHTLEHIPKAKVLPILEAARLALRPGGKLVVEVPNCEHPIVGNRNRYADFTHTLGFTDLSLNFVLRQAGFSQVLVYGCRTPRKSLGRLLQRTAQDTLELFAAALVRLYRPSDRLILASILGACATK